MSNSASASVSSSTIQDNNKDHKQLVTISEKVQLTRSQHEVLSIICNTYEEPVSQYMQEALVEAMRIDIEEGNFSDVLLQKITDKKEEKKGSTIKRTNSSSLTKSSIANDIGADLQF